MRQILLAAAVHLAAAPPILAQSPPLLTGLGSYARTIDTRSSEAQRRFDEGLALVYAFHHEQAEASFRAAIDADPRSAMAWWGLALAQSRTIDRGHHPQRDSIAFHALREARARGSALGAVDAGLLDALATRFASPLDAQAAARADSAYARAMAALWRRFPDDPDVGALYAEALMCLSPRVYWEAPGVPLAGREDLLPALELTLASAPEHLGANHFLIHVFEAAQDASPALASARRLESLAPAAGHLLHMSSHVHLRLGLYDDAIRANERAVAADVALFERLGGPPATTYGTGYHPHSRHFLWVAQLLAGRVDEALEAADALAATAHAVGADPLGVYHQSWAAAPLLVRVRARRWDEILDLPVAHAAGAYQAALGHFARGMALAGRGDPDGAGAERARLDSASTGVPQGALVAPLASAHALLAVARETLDAAIHAARGDTEARLAALRRAVVRQDAVPLMEPPPWYVPVRQLLGRALLDAGRTLEAEAAFRADLARHPHNPWSACGLAEAVGDPGLAAELGVGAAECLRLRGLGAP